MFLWKCRILEAENASIWRGLEPPNFRSLIHGTKHHKCNQLQICCKLYPYMVWVRVFGSTAYDMSIWLSYIYSTNAAIIPSRICIFCIGWCVKLHGMCGDTNDSSYAQWVHFGLSPRLPIFQQQTQLYRVYIPNWDILPGCFWLCAWLSLCWLGLWINHV